MHVLKGLFYVALLVVSVDTALDVMNMLTLSVEQVGVGEVSWLFARILLLNLIALYRVFEWCWDHGKKQCPKCETPPINVVDSK